ncbi:MAG TPA: oligosaccharide flippase family protein [Candidatus Paceibacterota bacterium]
MTGNKSFTRIVSEGSAWVLFLTVLLKILGLLSIFVVLSNLSVYEYGVVELVLSVLPIFSLFLLPGLNAIIVADMGLAKGRGEYSVVRGVIRAYGRMYLLLAVVAWALLFFGSEIVAHIYDEHFALFFKIISFSFLLSPIRMLCSVFFTYALRFREQSLIGFLEEIFKLAFVLVFVAYFGLGIIGMLLAIVLSQALALATLAPYGYRLYRTMLNAYPSAPVSAYSLLRSHAKWGMLATYVGSAGQSMRTWIIKSILGTEAVALFAVALGIYGHIISLVPISQVVGPMLSQQMGDIKRLTLLLSKSIKYQFVGFALAALGVGVVLPVLVFGLFPQYSGALALVLGLSLMLIPASFDTFFPHIFSAFQAQRSQFFATLYKVALTAALFPPALMLFGLVGACFALVAVTILYDLERYRAVRKLLPSFRLDLRGMLSYDAIDRQIVDKIRSAIPKL